MTCAISWIPKGVSKSEPVVAVADSPSKKEKDIQEFITLHSSESEDENEDGEVVDAIAGDDVIANAQASTVCDNITLALKDLNMERYDDEDEGVELFRSGDVYYQTNEMDPYLIDTNDDDDDELEDMIIYPTDSVIVSARCEKIGDDDAIGLLEVWIYEDRNKNMYVHHDITIPALPLCTAWLDCPLQGGERGNFLAVGSMLPSIEIWDLDVIEEVEPCVVLVDGGHTDSVQGLAWNKEYRNILASASADKRVKIWDVVAGTCDITLEHHSDKVQAVAWNHHAPRVLLSGSFDHTVVMKDVRMPSHSDYKWSVTADVESLAWDPHSEHSFVVSLENGIVNCFDIRTATSDSTSELGSTFTLHAHDKAVTSVSYNLSAPNLLATGSLDQTVKLWDLSNNQPSCVASHTPKVGAVFFVSFSEDNPFVLAIGGLMKKLKVWDTLSESCISQRYENYKK